MDGHQKKKERKKERRKTVITERLGEGEMGRYCIDVRGKEKKKKNDFTDKVHLYCIRHKEHGDSNEQRYYYCMVLSGEGHGAPLQSSCPENPMDGRSLVGRSPRGRSQSDTTERLPLRVSLSRLGGGHGNPLQCSCLENPRDRGAWWAAIYGVIQSRT